MGIHDRDYYRDDAGGAFANLSRQGVTVWLIAVTCAVWVAQLVTAKPRGGLVTEWGVYDPELILGGEVWRLLTPVFLHSETNLFHIVFNMMVLFWTGQRLEERYGGREFLLFYLVAGVFANGIYLLAYVAGLIGVTTALGASGAVTAALVLFAFNFPRQQVLLFFVIPLPIWLMVVIYVGIDVFGALGGRANNQPVAYLVHLGGALFATLYYQTGLQLAALLPTRRAAGRPRRPPLRVVPVENEPADRRADAYDAEGVGQSATPAEAVADEPLETLVDRILQKVLQHGQESLTADERNLLFRASERYKLRRR